MNWDKIVGQKNLKQQLINSINDKRVGHAQLLVGNEGYGVFPMALAMAKEILSRENASAASKVDSFNHLDLHFSFPVFSEDGKSYSKNKLPEWREMINNNPYASFEEWVDTLEADKKQFFISVMEADEMASKFALKSFDGGSRILIVWRADKINTDAANKLLKFLEEPPKDTYLILCADSTDYILPTILSRCQIINVPRIDADEMKTFIRGNYDVSSDFIDEIVVASVGNWNNAKKLLENKSVDGEFEELFIQWVRNAFMAKKKPQVIREIIKWSHLISAWSRDRQINFLEYCSEIFRLALMQNYGREDLVYKKLGINNFNWDAFTGYIHGANIESILEELSEASLHISRNANSKIIWSDMGIKLTRYIHRKA